MGLWLRRRKACQDASDKYRSAIEMATVVPIIEMLEQHRSNADPDTVTTKRLPVVMDDAAAPIAEALERNGMNLDSFLWNTADALGDRWPWAWVFFTECYPLASHVRSIRREPAEMPFTLYGREPDPVPPDWTPCVGAVMPMTKDVLRGVSAHSPMFESAWNALADRSADTHWACLPILSTPAGSRAFVIRSRVIADARVPRRERQEVPHVFPLCH